ncbi:MAG: hypothetical protein QXW10_02685 [Candidatus Micrarchaeaceae archaeon]
MEFDSEIDGISKYLMDKQDAFNAAMGISRNIIMEAGRIITMLHNNDMAEAKKKFALLSNEVRKLGSTGAGFEYHTLQAYQEYAEAAIMLAIKSSGKIPSISKVHVQKDAYLFGLMDAVGELKREVLEALRRDDTKNAEKFFDLMNKIYDSTRRLRFAEAILPGFRRKQDTARIQLENAGSEIVMFKNAHSHRGLQA